MSAGNDFNHLRRLCRTLCKDSLQKSKSTVRRQKCNDMLVAYKHTGSEQKCSVPHLKLCSTEVKFVFFCVFISF